MVPPMRDAETASRTERPRTDARPEAPDAVAWGQDAASTGEAPDLTVGAVAALVGVSVRTLHYWDTIGLVRPSQRSWSGYRLYSPADVTRLHQVLVYRETGLPLACIGELLDDPGTDALAHLRRQRDLLTEQLSRTMRMVRAVDTLIDRTLSTVGTSPRSGPLSPAEQAEILGTDWSPQYVAEAQERWGDTPEWAEATARQAAMTREDWEQVKARTLALEADLVAAMARGVEPGSQEANALAERHRADLGQWFTVTYPKQVLIARGYTADPRFAAHYDRQAPGLAAWLQQVVNANATAHGVDVEHATWC